MSAFSKGDAGNSEFLPDERGKPGIIDISPDKDGGILKRIVKAGQADDGPTEENPTPEGTPIAVNYVGYYAGEEFDRNHGGYPFEFILGERKVVEGWEVAVPLMCIGEKCVLTLAAGYAYGDKGSEDDIPPGATLVFHIEVVNIKTPANTGTGATDMQRLEELREQREQAKDKAAADKAAKEKSKAEAQAKMQAKLAAKSGKGKGAPKKGAGDVAAALEEKKKAKADAKEAEKAAKAAKKKGGKTPPASPKGPVPSSPPASPMGPVPSSPPLSPVRGAI